MKFLFDENLSPHLVGHVAAHWPGSTHVEQLGMRGQSDDAIWRYARDHAFSIVTKDDDFRSLALVRGAPPKVIWLQVGNASTAAIARLLVDHAQTIAAFDERPDEALLILPL